MSESLIDFDPVPGGALIPDMSAEGEYRRLGAPIAENCRGQRADAYLARNFPFLSRSAWQKRLEAGTVLVNGRAVKISARLRPADRITMYAPPAVEPEVDRGVRVLWEKSGVMAVYKPGNLPMHENGPYRKNTFTEIVWQEIGREWSAVHRLDRETSGIVLCGATPELRARLARALERRSLQKEYLAIARGIPERTQWSEFGPIGDLTESAIRIKKWVVPGGLPSQTDFRVLQVSGGACLLKAWPRTGRTNQIRIHAAYSGHVLFGDKLYHQDEDIFLEYFEHGLTESVIARTGFRRLCLHAAAVEFEHPDCGPQRVECPLPEDMTVFWSAWTEPAGFGAEQRDAILADTPCNEVPSIGGIPERQSLVP